MESLYNVSDDVIRLTDTVNEWLKTLADGKQGFREELLFFSRHVEGGMTTQRIQDLLLLIRSYCFLFDTYTINSVMVIRQSGMGWEDDVLIEVARSKNVDIQVIGKCCLDRALAFLKVYARALYYAVNVFRIKLHNLFDFKKNEPDDKEIVFQLCSSAYKHVGKIVPLMVELKNKGYTPCVLSWHSNERYTKLSGARQVRKEGLQADQLEKWCFFSDMLKSITGGLYTWKKAKGKKAEFLSYQGLSYQSISLGSLLWPSIRFFIIVELVQSYRLDQALKKYFKSHKPLAISLWGATILKQGYLAWKNLCPQRIPLVFHYALGTNIEWPYAGPDSPVDLVFMAGEIHRRIENMSPIFSSANIEVCGQARYEGIEGFKKKYSCTQSRLQLRIPTTFSMYILFDSNSILRGFMAPREQTVILNVLLNFASKYPFTAILVKPHPGHTPDILNDIINSREDLENVFLINNKMLPNHALNAADILITKFSTLGVEAMLFERPVISCVLDGEQRFNIYENAADCVSEPEKLETLLFKLVTDNGFRQEWHKKHLQMQCLFLSEYFCKMGKPPAVVQANILDRYLNRWRY